MPVELTPPRPHAPGRRHRPDPQNRLWLSHHWPGQEDRCVALGSRWVCRRCLVFHPLCWATMLLALAGLAWPAAWDPVLLWTLSVPVVLEWWLEHLGRIRYSPRRQVLTAALVAPAVGVGLARYLRNPGDGLFWSVVGTYAVLCVIPWVLSMRRPLSAPTPRSPAPGDRRATDVPAPPGR